MMDKITIAILSPLFHSRSSKTKGRITYYSFARKKKNIFFSVNKGIFLLFRRLEYLSQLLTHSVSITYAIHDSLFYMPMCSLSFIQYYNIGPIEECNFT